ncbi:M20/M25/M40 family metallo-hydrolase [Sediminibacillus dalangtanensis]|uniref:M20/M25/M40 family metallo-hydrolase n=1 Tax=Sediminibacillus dalangtanensis TaxID=2729421 RepID=A0ABX7VUP8_9BACI|nr:M20/M25/M40 family metallo-hydrolase [Sediminibacillus dalangtanensis]QTM99729.1 M20/M25/M40 family metallo-hydrolase [Sediminibacillus dalangtanensis]
MQEWQTKEQLTDLLYSLVRYPSISGSEDELALAEYLLYTLRQKEYFKSNPDLVSLHPLKDGRQLLTALVKQRKEAETVILLSHFDVVGIEDYGSLKNLAFHPQELTAELNKRKADLPELVQQDLDADGEWIFGRGTMDMKSGLAVHLSMVEKAISGEFDGNILLLTVPDEEVNSLGMITALPVLKRLRDEHGLRYRACLNGEPMFSKYPGDKNHYMYTGSIGKVLPGFLCYGKETHVGEPFAGLNANLMISFLSEELELNESFVEKVGEEVTPPPVSLMQRDLKEEYSVQTPVSAVSMYNVHYLKQSIEMINEKLFRAARNAATAIERHYDEKVDKYARMAADFIKPEFHVNVFHYEELYRLAVSQFGREEVERRQNLLIKKRDTGDRDFSTLLVQELAALCKEYAPMIVLFYSPPFYPAVTSHHDEYIAKTAELVRDYVSHRYGIPLQTVEYFPGLSDLSYIGPVASDSSLSPLTGNMPLQNKGFELPEDVMEQITMPILNVGPLGKDPHQWTERLELTYSFGFLPEIVKFTIESLLGSKK